jgi:hypothetical protein
MPSPAPRPVQRLGPSPQSDAYDPSSRPRRGQSTARWPDARVVGSTTRARPNLPLRARNRRRTFGLLAAVAPGHPIESRRSRRRALVEPTGLARWPGTRGSHSGSPTACWPAAPDARGDDRPRGYGRYVRHHDPPRDHSYASPRRSSLAYRWSAARWRHSAARPGSHTRRDDSARSSEPSTGARDVPEALAECVDDERHPASRPATMPASAGRRFWPASPTAWHAQFSRHGISLLRQILGSAPSRGTSSVMCREQRVHGCRARRSGNPGDAAIGKQTRCQLS